MIRSAIFAIGLLALIAWASNRSSVDVHLDRTPLRSGVPAAQVAVTGEAATIESVTAPARELIGQVDSLSVRATRLYSAVSKLSGAQEAAATAARGTAEIGNALMELSRRMKAELHRHKAEAREWLRHDPRLGPKPTLREWTDESKRFVSIAEETIARGEKKMASVR